MNQLLLERSAGLLGPHAFARLYTSSLVASIQHAPQLRFDGEEAPVTTGPAYGADEEAKKIWSHSSGVNAVEVDPFEGRLMISGGGDATIKLWNLEHITNDTGVQTLRPVDAVTKTSASAHKFGITALSFFPFDADAFISSSYDHTVKLYSTSSLTASASFNLDSIIYTQKMSPVATHLLVACATQHPAVRLIDLKSGSSTHSLPGHHGAVISVAWSPTKEHILASGGIDGTVRLWDVRRSASSIGMLDMEDSIGISSNGSRPGGRARESAKAHDGAVNALQWSDDGAYLVTAGHDDRIRVWNASSGANTLASFGPTLKNNHLSSLPLLLSKSGTTRSGKEVLIYPNGHEILVFELHDGKLLKRLKVPGPVTAAVRSRTGERNVRNRITSLSWRPLPGGFVSGHSDGHIRAWLPRTKDVDEADAEDLAEDTGTNAEEETARKRKVLEDVYRDLTKQKITFG